MADAMAIAHVRGRKKRKVGLFLFQSPVDRPRVGRICGRFETPDPAAIPQFVKTGEIYDRFRSIRGAADARIRSARSYLGAVVVCRGPNLSGPTVPS